LAKFKKNASRKNAKMATLLTIFQLRPRPATSLNYYQTPLPLV